MSELKTVYLVDGSRTPFLTQATTVQGCSALSLALRVSHSVLLGHSFHAQGLDAIITASTACDGNVDLARELGQRLGCLANISTISQTGDAAGLQALELASQQIALNQKQLILVGGVDVLQLSNHQVGALTSWSQQWKKDSQSLTQKIGLPAFLQRAKSKPSIDNISTTHTAIQALLEPNWLVKNKQWAEEKAIRHVITQDRMNEYAQLSRRRLQYSQRNNLIASLSPLFYRDGHVISRDMGGLTTDMVTLSTTATTKEIDPSNVLSDDCIAPAAEGAAMLLLASKESVIHYQLPVLATLSLPYWSHTSLADNTLLASGHYVNQAVHNLLADERLTMDEIDYWECNEASAVDVLVAQQQCQEDDAFALLHRVNVDGGVLALGNAPTANSMRMLLQLAHTLKRSDAEKGVVTATVSDGREFALLLQHSHELVK
jgi:acetyl-CoA C-acetyltransferase